VGGRGRIAGRSVTPRALAGLLGAILVFQAGLAWTEPEAYFSPNGGIRHRLLRAINMTKATIDLAVFDFTSGELAGALLAAKERGVVIRIVADARQAQGKHSEVPLLLARGVKVRLTTGQGRGLMHHKFALFDGQLVLTGSYNWTESAERANFENAVLLDNPTVVQRFQAQFESLFRGVPTRLLRTPL
jgi:phosphatidylserine/phosphatidylglycerophosphate/cardiolipin synthase-like enzyme